jgi:hypothetical protein
VQADTRFEVVRKWSRVVWGALPAITVATIIPLATFYGVSWIDGMKAGIIASLVWAWAMLFRQILSRGRRVSGLLSITAVMLSVRCVTWVVHQSAFTFFVVPVAETVAMGALFVGTLLVGRPLLVSLAHDFVPSLGDHLGHDKYKPLVRRLSCLWGAVYLGSAASSGVLLGTQNIHWFLLLHQLSGWVWTGAGLALSFAYGRRHGKELFQLVHVGLHPEPAAALT